MVVTLGKTVILKLILLFSSLFLSTGIFAQVWGSPGATWHFQNAGFALFDGITILSYERDTVIDNYPAQVIQTSQQYIYPGPNGPYQGPISTRLNYTRISGDTVFWYKNNQFFPLYDIGAQPGDSLVIYNDFGADPYCDSLSVIHVVNNGISTINGVDLRYIDVVRGANSNFGYSGRIYERMGSVSGGFEGYLWPTEFECDSAVYDYFEWQFNCYEDDNFGLYNPSGTACNPFEFVSLDELDTNEKEMVRMYDALGREISEVSEGLLFIHYSDGTIEKKYYTSQ